MNLTARMFESKHKEDVTPEASNRKLLTALEAAYYLGITPELLFSYTKWPCGAKSRRLLTTESDGQVYFNQEEIDDFDRYLRKPWVDGDSPRIPVPKFIITHLRAESSNQCTRCGSGIGVETAHIDAWETSRSHHHDNLIRICSQCHNEYDKHKSLSRDVLRAIKDKVVARTRAILARSMNPVKRQFISPRPERVFVGRSKDLEGLREELEASRTVLIRGTGGIGKTQLLLNALASVKTEQRVVWLDVEKYGTTEGLITAMAVMLAEETGIDTLDSLAAHLDALEACIVLDGAEHFTGPDLDELDDLVADLSNRTICTQLVVTSQVDMQRTIFDKKLVLLGLEVEPSRKLLRSLVQDGTSLDRESEAALLAFSEGHPPHAPLDRGID